MSATVLYMSMSLDGFIAGPNEGPGNGLGDGGHRLHAWFLTGADAGHEGVGRPAGVNGQTFDEFMATGAVVCGRGTIEPAGGWGGDHHDGVPIFVLSRHESDTEMTQMLDSPGDFRVALTLDNYSRQEPVGNLGSDILHRLPSRWRNLPAAVGCVHCEIDLRCEPPLRTRIVNHAGIGQSGIG